MRVDLIIPFYNENQNLKILCEEISKTIPQLNHDYFILFIDDGSIDDSCATIKKKIKNIRYKIINLPKNCGQTKAFEHAFSLLNSDYFIRMDSDLQDDPSDLKKFDDIIAKNFDIILGFRGKRKHTLPLKITTFLFDKIMKFLVLSNLKSSSGSFICFKSRFFKNLKLKENDHRYLTIIAQNKGAKKNITIDINHRSRFYGKSNYNTFVKIFFGFFEVLRLYKRIKRNFYDQ